MEGDIIKPNPDNRRDNVRKIQKHINHTIQNMELAEEMIPETDDPNTREALIEKNKRRERALEGFKEEIQDEARARKKDK
jgi:small acid-soluble spore protein (thioredoxin-like protein)